MRWRNRRDRPAPPPLAASGTDGHHSDLDLIARVRDGEARAFDLLFRRYRPLLDRFLTNLLRRPPVVDEVLNDTMTIVWSRADSFAGASKVSTWIYGIAYRQSMRALSRLDEPAEMPDDAVMASEEGPEGALGRAQAAGALARAMLTLSADHRAVVDLTYFHGMGYREIAEIMACPVDTVKTRMFHARRQLKRALDGDMADWL